MSIVNLSVMEWVVLVLSLVGIPCLFLLLNRRIHDVIMPTKNDDSKVPSVDCLLRQLEKLSPESIKKSCIEMANLRDWDMDSIVRKVAHRATMLEIKALKNSKEKDMFPFLEYEDKGD